MTPTIEKEVNALKCMTVTELQQKYLELFGEQSRSRHKQFLCKRIAWRLQALAEGDLSERARRRAEKLANDADIRVRAPKGAFRQGEALSANLTAVRSFSGSIDSRLPIAGTILAREYKGETIRVMVLDKGFEYEGEIYRSLSAIAKAVTGSHWNGFGFFGLGKRGNAK